MARIRTIKPEFFTSEDIVGLSPLARLLYIALWCEADREGRLVWKPKTFKMRYFPGDKCDIDALCNEILDTGLIVQYCECYAYIPTFHSHQHINPRESKSQLPEPDIDATVTRASRDSDAQGGREGKGKEGNDVRRVTTRASKKCPADFLIDDGMRAWANQHAPNVDIDRETEKMKDYTFGTAKTDWLGTWRNWMRRSSELPSNQKSPRQINGMLPGAI